MLVGHGARLVLIYQCQNWFIIARLMALYDVCILCVPLHVVIHLFFLRILFIFGMTEEHDMDMHILYRFYVLLIYAEDMAVYDEN